MSYYRYKEKHYHSESRHRHCPRCDRKIRGPAIGRNICEYCIAAEKAKAEEAKADDE